MNELTNLECFEVFSLSEKILKLSVDKSVQVAINAIAQSMHIILGNAKNKKEIIKEFIFVLETLGEEE